MCELEAVKSVKELKTKCVHQNYVSQQQTRMNLNVAHFPAKIMLKKKSATSKVFFFDN